ncbi:hypothetical protein [Microtetraspora sp. NBRC 16547]|uniref:hypothetical protein n=1 Tax=Microtetraspora sp. NBRC 16547 TaxID=3030993 RepID=UPI0025545E9F|nr:hypothetical protein [Microtetraspora sp. NBRC 16547]
MSASTAFIAGMAPVPADAEAERAPTHRRVPSIGSGGGGDTVHTGNGSNNSNISSVKSPTHNRGTQHTSTSAIGGETSVQNAFCRNVKVCNLTQKVTIVVPEKALKSDPGSANITDVPLEADEPEPDPVTTAGPGDVDPAMLDMLLLWPEPGLDDLW